MREPRVEKVTVHIGTGESGQRLVNAEAILKNITNHVPVRTVAKRTILLFGIKKSEPIGCRLTLRGDDAEEFLKVALEVTENRLRSSQFDDTGNFSFGVEEHTDFPGMKYDPEIGIFGMDIAVALKRPGYRVAKRRVLKRSISPRHKVSTEDAIEFVKTKYGVTVMEAA
ncbi:MAG: 50S ribosomal protein L5 [Methanotrichaceae archaeon]